jgi:signal transduction histidine kinase/anti-sigma regulatory factor (Ser/Thr protein kinase)
MQQEDKIEPLREALLNKLQPANLDISALLELTSQLARLDPDYVRFSVDAGHISRLGKELVAKQETAVSELVKNAYDADATLVELTFEETESPGGCLRIDDNGSGMNRSQLIDGFMRLSSTDKIRHPISPWYNRRRAGRKGIGRFAAQRLGDKLTVITQSQDADEAFLVEINWKQFEQERELGSIAFLVDKIKKKKEHGTTLIIEGLAEAWTEASMTRVYRYIADLIQPFPLSKASQKAELSSYVGQIDPGFDTKMYRVSDGEKKVVASVEKMIYEHALAEVDGYVDTSGRGFWSIKSAYFGIDEEKLEIGKEREQPKTPFTYLKADPDSFGGREIRLKAYYYIYNSKYIPRTQNKLIRELAKERGGIRIYRNGFRVLPYGELYDDWLRLDADRPSYAKSFAPYKNQNFFGFVELIDEEGKWFEETSSREGLIENEAFKELVDFVSRVLKTVAFRIAEGRERKKTEAKKSRQEEATATERIKAATEELSQVASSLESSVGASPTVDQQNIPRVREIIREIEEATAQQEEESEARLEEIDMLRVLASLGLTIGEFIHEIRHLLPAIRADANQFLRIHREEAEPRKYALRLQENLKSFNTYASFFDRAISLNARRETKSQELGVVIRSFIEAIKPTTHRYRIKILEPKIRAYDLFTLPMHPSEWSSILFNLFTNAKKAIDRAGSQGQILISAGRKKQHVYLEFADNGDGITPENEERIFDAFFTTASPASPLADEQEELLGTGLGLKILKDIVTSYKGNIRLVTPPENFSTCFRIELPRATDKELKDYAYY